MRALWGAGPTSNERSEWLSIPHPHQRQSMMATKRKPRFVQPEAPAVIRPTHVQDRIISIAAGAPKAWRDRSPLELAYERGRLAGGSKRYTASQRFEAGQNYAKICLTADGGGGRDSTQALNVSRSGGGFTLPQSQQTAIRTRIAIESHMGQRDRQIIRRVCGDGCELADAIKEICGDYKFTVSDRFREALDSLIEAMEQARKHPGRFSMAVKN